MPVGYCGFGPQFGGQSPGNSCFPFPPTASVISDATAMAPTTSPTVNIAVLPFESWRSWKPLIPSLGISTCSPAQMELEPRMLFTRLTLTVTDVSEEETTIPSIRSASDPSRSPASCRPRSFSVMPTFCPDAGGVS